jgi:hypothetical protein
MGRGVQHGVDGVLIENMHDTPYCLPQHLGEFQHIYFEIFLCSYGPIPAYTGTLHWKTLMQYCG